MEEELLNGSFGRNIKKENATIKRDICMFMNILLLICFVIKSLSTKFTNCKFYFNITIFCFLNNSSVDLIELNHKPNREIKCIKKTNLFSVLPNS